MKKLIFSGLASLLLVYYSYSQSSTATNFWAPGRFLGYTNAADLDFLTTNLFRMRLNQNKTIASYGLPYNVNAFYINHYGPWVTAAPLNNADGYVGINTQTPITRLHIQGSQTSTPSVGTGWRPWMRTGVYMNEESNNMYVGMYSTAPEAASDAVVNWGDDGLSNPNRLRVNFTESIGSLPSSGVPVWLREREMMSFWPSRFIGVGDFINFTGGPQSHLHMHNDFDLDEYLQISFGFSGSSTFDGLRIGLPLNGNSPALMNSTGIFYNQENSPLLFSMAAPTAGVNLSNGTTTERFRITNTSANTWLGTGIGNWNPGGFAGNITRIGISHDPNNPVSRPLSLLHIGYNTPNGIANTAGWRPWMDVGVYASQNGDHVFLGLKNEGTTDRMDAVLSWGDNSLFGGPDNLRFIFTEDQSVTNPPATDPNGLEVVRVTPITAVSTAQQNGPSFGIGNFVGIPPAALNYVGATLDVDGDARIRLVTQNTTLNQVLVRDPNDYGRVYWRDANSFAPNIGANNGCTIDPLNPGIVQLGYGLSSGSPAGFFTDHRIVPMVNYNILWQGLGVTNGNLFNVGIFNPWTGTPFSSKFYTRNDHENTAGHFETECAATIPYTNTFAGYIGAEGSVYDMRQSATGVFGLGNASNFGGAVLAQGDVHGVLGFAFNNTLNNLNPIGVGGFGAGYNSSVTAYGGRFEAQEAAGSPLCYGVYASVTGGGANPNSYAGFFTGGAVWTQTINYPSDSTIKTNINPIGNAWSILDDINVYSYYYNTAALPQANFDNEIHFGVISQELETVLPSLVHEGIYQAVLDSLKDTVYVADTIKGVEYVELIPILIQGMKDLKDMVTDQRNLIGDLQNELDYLQGELNACCELRQSRTTNPERDEIPVTEMEVTLTNDYMVVLEQNVPNPFAENTTINFHIPDNVQDAQMFFSDMNGKLIKTLEIKDRGWGRVSVFAQDLSSGVYTYSLVLDGKVYETKKMVKE